MKLKVALIEDHPTMLNLYANMLVKSGSLQIEDVLVQFLSAEEFLAHADNIEKFFDVVICDHNLGKDKMDGFTLLNQLLSYDFEGLPILLTVDNSDEMLNRIQNIPSIQYVFKGSRIQETNPYVILKSLIDDHRKS